MSAAAEEGLLTGQPVEPLAHALFGALTEMALLIANAADQAAARHDAETALRRLIAGLLGPPPTSSPARRS